MYPIKTILFPTDFSENADQAFPFACSLAKDHGAEIVVLHVYPPPVAYGEELARRQPPNGYERDLWRLLRQYEAPDKACRVSHRLEEGDLVKVILWTAEDLGCDLIVMGTHGRTGLARALMGSVAEAVVRRAPCPVLTVKHPAVAVKSASKVAAKIEQV
jgi:nucleotide-binding universal stress UspA family protein